MRSSINADPHHAVLVRYDGGNDGFGVSTALRHVLFPPVYLVLHGTLLYTLLVGQSSSITESTIPGASGASGASVPARGDHDAPAACAQRRGQEARQLRAAAL